MKEIFNFLSLPAVSGFIGFFGGLLAAWFALTIKQRSDDRTRKLEKLLKQSERQIEEFYGPLNNMVYQLYVCHETKAKLISHFRGDEIKIAKIEQYFRTNYLWPLHTETRDIIKKKLYLIEGPEMPESFYYYLRHSLQERDQWELYEKFGIDSSFLQGLPWPSQFEFDIKKGFKTAMANYEFLLNGFKGESDEKIKHFRPEGDKAAHKC
jgi:hypothetical protein